MRVPLVVFGAMLGLTGFIMHRVVVSRIGAEQHAGMLRRLYALQIGIGFLLLGGAVARPESSFTGSLRTSPLQAPTAGAILAALLFVSSTFAFLKKRKSLPDDRRSRSGTWILWVGFELIVAGIGALVSGQAHGLTIAACGTSAVLVALFLVLPAGAPTGSEAGGE